MKRILVFFTVCLFSINALASNSITHDIERSALARKNSTIVMTVEDHTETEIKFTLDYDIKTNIPFVGRQEGAFDMLLPIAFASEEAYLRLEDGEDMSYDNAIITFIGREDINGYEDCYVIRIDNTKSPRKDDRWMIDAYYHPSIPSTGWAHIDLTYKLVGIPIKASSNIREELDSWL